VGQFTVSKSPYPFILKLTLLLTVQTTNTKGARGPQPERDGTGTDRSLADFMGSKWPIERGWSIEETTEKLAEVSAKAQERI
jgi:hypothetical protein